MRWEVNQVSPQGSVWGSSGLSLGEWGGEMRALGRKFPQGNRDRAALSDESERFYSNISQLPTLF